MRVLVLSHMYPNIANPISGIFVHEQVQALTRAGCEVKVVAPLPWVPPAMGMINEKWRKYKETPKNEMIGNIEVYRPAYFDLPRNYLFEYSGWTYYFGIKRLVKKIYQEWPFDLIHAHVALPDGYAAMLLNRYYKKPLVLTIHGQDMQYTIYHSQKAKNEVIEVLNHADTIISVSNKLRKSIIQYTDNTKVITIANGFNTEDLYEGESPLKDKYKGKTIILSVGNLIETKGHEFMLLALRDIVNEFDNVMYLIIGEGSYKDKLIQIVKQLELGPYVEFLGRLPHKKTMEYMSICDMFVLPSWEEGFGIVYLEAMAHGKPVIGCKGQGIEDFVIDKVNGILVENKDPHSLKEAVIALLRTPDYAMSMGQKAKEHVMNNLTWGNNASRVLDVYNKLV